MDVRPVRLTISDDLRRGHGSVFFRAWLALPLVVWFSLWGIVALIFAIANWLLTLFTGEPSPGLHRFLVRYVRFTAHTQAYLTLAAEPLPAFDGKPGYPIDLEFEPPARQNRWTVLFRLVLAFPAVLLASALINFDVNGRSITRTLSVIVAAAVLGWFFALARGRMPRGLRDLIAYAISYGAQLSAYLLVLTDRYPSSDPETAIGPLPVRDDPVQMTTDDDLRRSRLTVFFRLPLAVPHLVWLTLWGVAALLAAIANWFAIMFTGVAPQSLHRFLAAYLRYQLHVFSFLYVVGNPFPGFTGAEGSYPIELRVADAEPQNRWTVFFRLVLVLPALLLANVFTSLATIVAILGWFASMFTGRMPVGLRNTAALALRYIAQANGYLLLVTGAYPYSGPCLAPSPPAPAPELEPVPPPLPV